MIQCCWCHSRSDCWNYLKKKIGLGEMNVKISIYTWTGKCY